MTHPLVAVVNERFGGIVSTGAHQPDGVACIREAASVARGVKWTDKDASGLPDIRPLNDSQHWPSDEARTAAMLAIGVAYWNWPRWSEAKRRRVVRRIALRTIREVLPLALTDYPEHAEACRRARTLEQARSAARAADDAAAAADAAAATDAYAYAAAYAADVAAYVAANAADALTIATRIWVEAAKA